ncbi:glycosyltransferase [Paenibacillus sp. MMO-177]|uniref:glycosyltransferase n=1 Tax=Paenibacillus sp. MMO-177 TaxID=3081289 RepID=UPI00301B0F3A
MSVYNERDSWLKESIESILKQSYSNFEFIIVLDQPQNEVLKQIILEYAEIDNRVKLIVNEKNYGLVYSLNRALGIAQGDFIARMDADDIATHDRFEKQINVLNQMGYDIVASALQYIDEEGNNLGLSSCYGQTPEKCRNSLSHRSILAHPTWMFKREILNEIGLYHNVVTAEDYDFLCRAVSSGKNAINMPEILLKYRIRNNGISIGKAFQQQRTMYIIQNEYKKTFEKSVKYNSRNVMSRTEKIDFNKRYSFFSYTTNIYKEACNLIKNNKIKGYILLPMSIVLNYHNLINLVSTKRLKEINR